MDAYRHGLDGPQAAWANRAYHGHRTFPQSLLTALDHVKLGNEEEAAQQFRAYAKSEKSVLGSV